MNTAFWNGIGLLGIGLLFVLGGCYHGPDLDSYAPAHNPAGVATKITLLDRTRIAGELLAVREDGLIVADEEEVFWIPFSHIRSGDFEQNYSLSVYRAKTPSPSKLQKLRLLSRFPQGLDGELLQRLLAAYHQTELTDVRQ